MNELFKLIKNDRIIFRFFILSLTLIIITILYIVINYQNLPPVVPLFNQLPWGPQRLIVRIGIFIPDLIVFSIFLINLFLSLIVYKKIPLVSRMLAVTSCLISLLTFLFIFRTVQIVL